MESGSSESRDKDLLLFFTEVNGLIEEFVYFFHIITRLDV
jgi:hypothetical protein